MGNTPIFAQDLKIGDTFNITTGATGIRVVEVREVRRHIDGAIIAVETTDGLTMSFKAEHPIALQSQPPKRIPRGFDATATYNIKKQTEPVPLDTVQRYAALMDFAAGTRKVEYVRADFPHEVFSGIVRALVRDENGGLLFGGICDDNYVRITSTAGPEFFIRIGLITAMFEVVE